MARGWESKSIESQIDDAGARPTGPKRTPPNKEESEMEAQKRSLLLSRTRVLHDLETATHERYQEMLRKALAHLDEKIAQIDARLAVERE